MSPATRSAVAMSQSDLESFLDSNHKCHLGTAGPDGIPHLATLFYAMIDGRVAFWTFAKSQKVLNMIREPRVSLLVENGWEYEELQGVMLRGRAQILYEEQEVRSVAFTVATGVRGQKLDASRLARIERQISKRVAVLITPDHVSSWDHRLLRVAGELT